MTAGVDLFYNNLMGQIWGLFRNFGGKSFRYASRIAQVRAAEPALLRLEQRLHRLQQRRLEGLYSANGDVDNLTAGFPHSTTPCSKTVDGKEFRRCFGGYGRDFLRGFSARLGFC